MHSHSEIAQTLISASALPPAPIKRPRWHLDPADWPVAVLALMMFLVPALGVPSELMLQDTLKSALVAFGVLVMARGNNWNLTLIYFN